MQLLVDWGVALSAASTYLSFGLHLGLSEAKEDQKALKANCMLILLCPSCFQTTSLVIKPNMSAQLAANHDVSFYLPTRQHKLEMHRSSISTHPTASTFPSRSEKHPQPLWLGHLFHGRYSSLQTCTLPELGVTLFRLPTETFSFSLLLHLLN